MNALISPNEQARYISSWTENKQNFDPVYTVLGQRVAEVSETTFPVTSPLFWMSCSDDIMADRFYYDTNSSAIVQIPADVLPPQPVTSGTNTI